MSILDPKYQKLTKKCRWQGIRDVYRETHNSISSRRGRPAKYIIEPSLDDPSPPEEQVPVWAWVLGLTVATIITVTIMATQFDIVSSSFAGLNRIDKDR